jgi:hypothetical protein
LPSSSYVAPTVAPTAAQNATAVRTELATELGRIDATVSSRLASASYVAPTVPPTAAQNAAAVRTELATELGRIDISVSSRLASASYVAPFTPSEIASAVNYALATDFGSISSAIAAIDVPSTSEIWSFGTRTLTVPSGLTLDQSAKLDQIASTTGSMVDAVWQKVVEAGFTAEQVLRILAAQAAGTATGLNSSSAQFYGLDGTTVRIAGEITSDGRNVTSLDGD